MSRHVMSKALLRDVNVSDRQGINQSMRERVRIGRLRKWLRDIVDVFRGPDVPMGGAHA